MDRASKILFFVILLAVIAVGAYKYKGFMIDRDFVVYSAVSCNPATESCFVWDCEETDPECDLTPYKKIEKLVANIPECGPTDECAELACQPGEEDCEVLACSEDTLEEGEVCLVAAPTIEMEPEAEPTSQEGQEATTTESLIIEE